VPTALITGIEGQDGSYLAELLLREGYHIVGLCRTIAPKPHSRIEHLLDTIELAQGDFLDESSLIRLVDRVRPNEIYNLAAHSFSKHHEHEPVLTAEIAAIGVTRLLEAIRKVDTKIRFFQASSSEMFGRPVDAPQTEGTPLHPANLYAIAKVYAHLVTGHYRTSYGIFACSGILFNHESPRRSPKFVTRKIANTAAKIRLGIANTLELGNLDARRDWGYAADFVSGMRLMLRHTTPDDYVLATGETHTVRELCELAFGHLGLDYREYVTQRDDLVRPNEETLIVGDATKAQMALGWKPTVSFEELVKLMVESDLRELSGQKADRR
jgi:GDPmannose 4,6-dehydratase